jgi:hypothetical protein
VPPQVILQAEHSRIHGGIDVVDTFVVAFIVNASFPLHHSRSNWVWGTGSLLSTLRYQKKIFFGAKTEGDRRRKWGRTSLVCTSAPSNNNGFLLIQSSPGVNFLAHQGDSTRSGHVGKVIEECKGRQLE